MILYFPLQTSCLAKFLFWINCHRYSWPIRLQDSLKCNICKKNLVIKLIFLQINIRVSNSWVLLFLVGDPKVPKITSLQYLCSISRKRGGINLIFLHEDKRVFYKLIVSFLLVIARHIQIAQRASLQFLCNIAEKKGGTKLIFFVCR